MLIQESLILPQSQTPVDQPLQIQLDSNLVPHLTPAVPQQPMVQQPPRVNKIFPPDDDVHPGSILDSSLAFDSLDAMSPRTDQRQRGRMAFDERTYFPKEQLKRQIEDTSRLVRSKAAVKRIFLFKVAFLRML